jgi:glutamyl/glutaminyl-tRNA synthetase
VNTAACKLDFTLLSRLNQVELAKKISEDTSSVVHLLRSAISSSSMLNTKTLNMSSSEYLEKVVRWCPERVSTIQDLLTAPFSYLWSRPGPDSISKISSSSKQIEKLALELEKYLVSLEFSEVEDTKKLSQFIQNYASSEQIKFKDLMRDMRLALCGLEVSLLRISIFIIM